MAITSDPSQKHAFLFTGDTTQRWVEDLKKVFATLTGFYNYPSGNIYVVSGDAALVPADFPGAIVKQVNRLNGTTDYDLEKHLSDFLVTSDITNHTIVFYFTGAGAYEQITLNGSADVLDKDWLGNIFLNITNAFTHVIMQQGYSGSFENAVSNIGSSGWTFTSSCSDAQDCSGDTAKSYFTDAWVAALQFNIYSGKYAYELSPVTDPDTDDNSKGLLINMRQAWQFAKDKLPSYSGPPADIPTYSSYGSETPYLGLPAFLIRDGNPEWWESPDIYINQPGIDLYNQNQVNTVFINIKNTGTHPVWNFRIGAKHFGTGLTAADAIITEKILLPSNPLKPEQTHLFQYDQTFSDTTTHRCIKARVKLAEVTADEINEWSDWSNTLIQANDFEAQRNIDPAIVSPPPPLPAPAPEEAENPEQEPQPDPGDENNTGDRSLRNIRGFKEHIYTIENPFKEKRIFRLVFGRDFIKIMKLLDLKIYCMDNTNPGKYGLLKISRFIYPHVSFELGARERIDLLFSFALKPKSEITRVIKVPIEILVRRTDRASVPNLRKSTLRNLRPVFVPVGGITAKIMIKELLIKGHVYNREGKPVPEATVFIRTINGKQASVLKTDKNGAYMMPRINPDAYRLHAKTKEWQTRVKIINLYEKEMVVDFSEKEKEEITEMKK